MLIKYLHIYIYISGNRIILIDIKGLGDLDCCPSCVQASLSCKEVS